VHRGGPAVDLAAQPSPQDPGEGRVTWIDDASAGHRHPTRPHRGVARSWRAGVGLDVSSVARGGGIDAPPADVDAGDAEVLHHTAVVSMYGRDTARVGSIVSPPATRRRASRAVTYWR
jgi:hypothetical protein